MNRIITALRLFNLYRRAGNSMRYAARRAWEISA